MIILSKEKDFPVKNYKHPWIYQNSIKHVEPSVNHGDIVKIADSNKNILGYGFYSANSKIACRVISFTDTLDSDWIKNRIESALSYRKLLEIDSNAYRLINAEGDFFPGLIIDVYNTILIIKPSIFGIEKILPEITSALENIMPQKSFFLKRDEKAARIEHMKEKTGFIKGNAETIVEIKENKILYLIDFLEGQKTGFYLDQRENRSLCSQYAKNKRVLNMFSYTGGFSLASLKGGAQSVISVDSSSAAISLGQKSLDMNKDLSAERCSWVKADAFAYLEKAELFDIIILDPPPFARSKKDQNNAIKGYKQLNLMALKKLNKNGIMFSFSCSQAVTKEIMLSIISEAGRLLNRNIRICKELTASEDHPYSSLHPEGEYLKGFIIHAE